MLELPWKFSIANELDFTEVSDGTYPYETGFLLDGTVVDVTGLLILAGYVVGGKINDVVDDDDEKDAFIFYLHSEEAKMKCLNLELTRLDDDTAPVLSDGNVDRTSDTEATIGFTTDEMGSVYYVVRDSGTPAPSNTEVKAGESLGGVYEMVRTTNVAHLPKQLAVTQKPGARHLWNRENPISLYFLPLQLLKHDSPIGRVGLLKYVRDVELNR